MWRQAPRLVARRGLDFLRGDGRISYDNLLIEKYRCEPGPETQLSFLARFAEAQADQRRRPVFVRVRWWVSSVAIWRKASS